jgi:hypothetical protein
MGAEGDAIGLADPGYAVIRGQLDEHEIAPAEVWRRVSDDKDLDILQFHPETFMVGNPARAAQ